MVVSPIDMDSHPFVVLQRECAVLACLSAGAQCWRVLSAVAQYWTHELSVGGSACATFIQHSGYAMVHTADDQARTKCVQCTESR